MMLKTQFVMYEMISTNESLNLYKSEVAELVVTQTGIKYPYLTEQFVVVMITSFAVMFFESAMEASLTPMTAYFFHWENYENSICYVCLGLCALTGYIIIMVLQNKIKLEDRTALLIGAIGVTIGQTLAFFALPQGYYGCPWILPVFAAVIGISVVSLPPDFKLIYRMRTLTDKFVTIIVFS